MSELEVVDYGKVAQHIRAMEPRALTPADIHDVLTIIEWMQEELVARDADMTKREAAVKERELAVDTREKDVVLRARVVGLSVSIGKRPRRSLFGNLLR